MYQAKRNGKGCVYVEHVDRTPQGASHMGELSRNRPTLDKHAERCPSRTRSR